MIAAVVMVMMMGMLMMTSMISGGIGVDDDNDGMMPTFIDDQC